MWDFSVLSFYRCQKESMINLRDALSDASKDRRRRRNLVNLHITFLGWLVEFSGFFMILLGSFILGHGDSFTTLCLQMLTMTIYFNILPLVFLINDSYLKACIAESKFYVRISGSFKNQHQGQNKVAHREDEGINQSK